MDRISIRVYFIAVIILGLTYFVYVGSKVDQKEQCQWDGEQSLIQLGSPRTASTWQAEVLCRALQLKTEHLHKDPDYYLSCTYSKAPISLDSSSPKHFSVIKTHQLAAINRPEKTTLFFSSSAVRGSLFATPHELCYSQLYEQLLDRGLNILRDYQAVFQLSEPQYVQLHTYMRLWEITRKCCGFQASCNNIVELTSRQKEGRKYGDKFDVATDYPACSIYNLTALELMLEETAVWKQRTRLIEENKHNKPLEFHFTGPGYCQATNEEVKQGLGMNGRPLEDHSRAISCHKP